MACVRGGSNHLVIAEKEEKRGERERKVKPKIRSHPG